MDKPSKNKKPLNNKKQEKQITQLTEDLKRAHADFINYRRRSEEEQSQIMSLAKKEVVTKFLPVLDDTERALAHLPKNASKDPLAQGYRMLERQLQSTLQQLGVTEIPARGAEFNPHLHEAVEHDPAGGDMVSQVLKKGYQLGEIVLRPAVVKVGKLNNKKEK